MTDGVLVNRLELKQMLLQMKKAGRVRESTTAYVYSESGLLRIQTEAIRLGVPARGDLLKTVAINAAMLSRAHRTLGLKKEILIQIVGSDLCINEFALSGEVQDAPPDFLAPAKKAPKADSPPVKPSTEPLDALSIPRNPTDKLLLRIEAERTKKEIEMSGLSAKIDKALMERNRRITLALKQIERYGVTHRDLRNLVADAVKRE
jgi:hypothetical protein